ncbi:MAG: hypothetical protein CL772_05555 [Chloroflexi bacterium]|nr:hypothetical protein [Chloroflexota bacterium]
MHNSWIENTKNNKKFLITQNKDYSFKDYSNLILEYYDFARENIKHKEKICFISNNVIEYAVFSNLIPMIGGIFVPLNPKSPKNEIESKMNLIGSKKIIYDDSIDLEKIKGFIYLKSQKRKNSNNNLKTNWPNENDPFCILFTSGSSGHPKAVSITRKNIEFSCKASQENLNVTDKDIWLLCMPPYHAGGLSIIYRSIILSKIFYILDTFDAYEVMNLIKESKVSIVSLVPTMLNKILDIMEKNKISAPKDFNFVLCGGAKIPENLISRAKKSNIKVLPTYGMTEASSQIATANPEDLDRPNNSVGKILSGLDIRFSKIKEIQIKGANIAKYLNQKHNSWLETGDYGYLDKNGYLFVEGRIDEMIISGGENINPREIEEEVNKIPEIAESYVFGSDDSYWGQKVNLYISLIDNNKSLELEEIKKSLSHIDSFKIPKVLHISKSGIPKLSNGKIDRKKIEELINE